MIDSGTETTIRPDTKTDKLVRHMQSLGLENVEHRSSGGWIDFWKPVRRGSVDHGVFEDISSVNDDKEELSRKLKDELSFEDECLKSGDEIRETVGVNDLYKISLTIPVEAVDDVLELLVKETGGMSFFGKVGVNFSDESEKLIPRMVLYTSGTRLNYVMEAGLLIDRMLQKKLGDPTDRLPMPATVALGNYVYLSQGLYGNKMKLKDKDPELFKNIYTEDGVMYKKPGERLVRDLERTRNQILIYERLNDFTHIPISQRLEALQKAEIEGVKIDFPDDFRWGIRSSERCNVTMGSPSLEEVIQLWEEDPRAQLDGFYPVHGGGSIVKIMNLIDEFYQQYIPEEENEPNEKIHASLGKSLAMAGLKPLESKIEGDEINRLCAWMFAGLIAVHPLMNGNRQTILNCMSSILLEQGCLDYFISNPVGMEEVLLDGMLLGKDGRMGLSEKVLDVQERLTKEMKEGKTQSFVEVDGVEHIINLNQNNVFNWVRWNRRKDVETILKWMFAKDNPYREAFIKSKSDEILVNYPWPENIPNDQATEFRGFLLYSVLLFRKYRTDQLVGDYSTVFTELEGMYEKEIGKDDAF